MLHRPTPDTPGPDQESVWDYPRPPRLEAVPKRVRIEFNSVTIADSTRAYRVLETSHPPVYYIPPGDIRMEYLRREPGRSFCEYKGQADYYSVVVDSKQAVKVAWAYPDPTERFAALTDHLAFYAGPMDGCWVGDDRVMPQPGGFYGGWITPDVVGPFKGNAGSEWW